jgi:hypothetical protein
MNIPTSRLMELMTQAAHLRSQGLSWEAIAARLGRTARTCQSWQRLHPAIWKRLWQEATKDRDAGGDAEARLVLRNILRSADNKSRLSAAQHLLRKSSRTKARKSSSDRVDPELSSFIIEIKELSDEELDQALRPITANGGADPGADGSPSTSRSEPIR